MTFTSIDPSLTPSVQTNIIVNGGFEVWQRGTSFVDISSPLGQAYTADRWSTYYSGSSFYHLTVTKETSVIDSIGLASMKCVTTFVASDFAAMRQNIENVQDYRGKRLTVSIRCKTTVAGMCNVNISTNSGGNTSSFHSGSGNWETLTASLTVGAADTSLSIYLNVAQGTNVGTSYWDNVMLVTGSTSPTFMPLLPQQDLANCQRYYVQAQAGDIVGGFYNGAGGCILFWHFPVPMRVAPTLTIPNPFTVDINGVGNTNFNSGGAAVVSTTSAKIQGTTTNTSYTFGSIVALEANGAGISASADL